MNTQLGKIADMIQTVGFEKTPLQRRLEQLGRGLAMAALAMVAVVFVSGPAARRELDRDVPHIHQPWPWPPCPKVCRRW